MPKISELVKQGLSMDKLRVSDSMLDIEGNIAVDEIETIWVR